MVLEIIAGGWWVWHGQRCRIDRGQCGHRRAGMRHGGGGVPCKVDRIGTVDILALAPWS